MNRYVDDSKNKQVVDQQVVGQQVVGPQQVIRQNTQKDLSASFINLDDAIPILLSVGYDSGMDWNKIDMMMLMEKTSFNVLGKMLSPILNDFLPKFLKDKSQLFRGSNQIHLTRGLVAGMYKYYTKNESFNKSVMSGVVEGGSSLIGKTTFEMLSLNPNFQLENEAIL